MRLSVMALLVLALGAGFGLAQLVGTHREQADLDPVAGFREALADRDPLTRSHRLSESLQGLGPEELPEFLEILRQHRIGVTAQEVRLLMLAWTRFDAPGAFAWARDYPARWSGATLLPQALYAWGYRDAPAALEALESLEDAELRASLREPLLEGWAASDDKQRASEYIASIPEPRPRRRFSAVLAGEAMRGGVEAVIRWAEAVPEDAPHQFRATAFYQAMSNVARRDPPRAIEWYETHRDHAYTTGLTGLMARKWVLHLDAPEPLFDWLAGLPADGARADEHSEALADGFRRWRSKSPDRAEAWLRQVVPGPGLDAVIVEMVRAQTGDSPESALEWVVHIQDEPTRTRRTVRAAREWRSRDPEAAEAWLEASELPQRVRQAILSEQPEAPVRRNGGGRPRGPAAARRPSPNDPAADGPR